MAAWHQGDIGRTDLEEDVAAGLIRPSILFQVDHDGMTAGELPKSLIDMDAATPVAEVRPSAQQLEMIATVRFALPRKRFEPVRPRQTSRRKAAATVASATVNAKPASGIFRYGPLARRNIRSYRGFARWVSEVCRNAVRNPSWLMSRLRSVSARVINGRR